jgi:hypothetical protein
VALIAIEEHWNSPALTSAVKALPKDRGDIEQFLTAFPTDDDREKFTAGNACALFGISLSTK